MHRASDDINRVASHLAPTSSDYAPNYADTEIDIELTASHRLRALASLSGSLTDSLTAAEAANFIEHQALVVLAATSAVVMTLGEFPTAVSSPDTNASASSSAKALHLVHAIGIPGEVRAALERLPLNAAMPLAEVARIGDPLFLQSESALLRYPDWGAAMIAAGSRAAAIVPVWANGELRGVLGLTWGAPRHFDGDERAFVVTLGTMCAQALMRSKLRAAEQLAREAAERANSSKAQFLATISHELRTPINAVMGYAQLLAEEIYGPVSEVQKKHLGRVRASGTHLLELVEELLSYARIEAGVELVRAAKVLALDIVEQSLVLVRPMAEKKGLQIRVEGYAQPLELFTDVRKLRQILVNLLANAVKFTSTGDIVLIVHAGGKNEDGTVSFEVTDTGRGIAVENYEHVFDAFWQEDHTTVHNVGSSGLGLSVARQLARLLGGDVLLAQSRLGRGSTFVATLPIAYAG
jgi:signal transduction histidine kinase